MTVAGRRVLVTGVAGGIGTAIATTFAAHGASVVGCDLASPPSSVPLHDFVAADLGDLVALERVITAVRSGGGCEALVNAAATIALGDPRTVSPEEFARVVDVNVRSMWFLGTELRDSLSASGRGSIVNLGSTHPRTTKRSSFPYNVSKGAVLSLTTALAVDLGTDGIRVNSVSPGIVDTAPTRQWIESTEDPAATKRRLAGDHPLGRLPTVDDVAAAVLFLASDAAAGITGIDLVVDAGRQALRH